MLLVKLLQYKYTNPSTMKKHKLHQRLSLFLALMMFLSCSQKNFPVNDTVSAEQYHSSPAAKTAYVPEPVITLPDEKAQMNKEGEMYYDNAYGYRYWRMADGRYYLDSKYESGAKPDKKIARKNLKKPATQQVIKTTAEGLANSGT
jgi:hypothetical protein